jgi:cytochrome b involved in lipid metabolism
MSKMGTRNEKAQDFDQEATYQEDSEDFKAPPQPRISRIAALFLGLIILAGIGTGVYFFMEENNYRLKKETAQNENFQGTVSLLSITEHDYAEDCWVAYHGNVYDMTEYAMIHPGKPSLITDHCGTDATVWFDYEHPVSLLSTVNEYLLGTLGEVSAATQAEDEEEALVGEDLDSSSSTDLDSSSSTSPSVSPKGEEQQVNTRSPTIAPTRSPVATQFSPTRTPATATPTPQPSEPPVADGCPMERYTLDDIWEHNDESSCWYALYGVVYDVTDYIDAHPGGRGHILAYCGREATDDFEAEKKHDIDLLLKVGFSSFIIGRQGSTSGTEYVPCDEVDLVSVSLARP